MYKVLVDTCIWSEVLRRKAPDTAISASLAKLLRDLRAVLIELLSCLPDAPIATSDYELAAQYANMCRRKGIQGSAIDFLICAVAVRNDLAIYTVDKDFEHYRTVIPITLWVEK